MSENKPRISTPTLLLLLITVLLAAAFLFEGAPNRQGQVSGESPAGDVSGLEPGPSQTPEDNATKRDPGRHEHQVMQPGSGQLGPDASQPPPPPGLPIAGSILNQDGRPLTGMGITATAVRLFEGNSGEDAGKIQHAVSDSSGFFLFESLPEGEYLLQTVSSNLYPTAQRRVRSGNQQADLVVADGRNTLFVAGRISNTDQQPVAGVQISLPGRSPAFAFSGVDGYYSLEFIADPHQSSILQFRHPDYHLVERILGAGDFDGTDILSLDLVLQALERTAGVSGVLIDRSGQAIAGQEVSLYSETFRKHHAAKSDMEGKFSFSKIAVGRDYRLQVLPRTRHKDYTQHGINVPDAGLELTVVLDLVNTGNLAGLMVNSEGAPIADFNLQLVSQSAKAQHLAVRSDRGGEFYLANVPAGRISFFSHSEPRLSAIGLLLEAGETRDVTLVLDWGPYLLQGQVVDSTGSPVGAASVSLTWSVQQGDLRNHSVRTAVADQAGNFLFTQLGSGWHKLDIRAPGYQPFRMEVPVGRDSQHVLAELESLQQD